MAKKTSEGTTVTSRLSREERTTGKCLICGANIITYCRKDNSQNITSFCSNKNCHRFVNIGPDSTWKTI